MAISYASNTQTLSSINKLNQATNSLSQTFQRLSSGLRINKASDDPAGLHVADKLRTDARIAAVAIRNANDGISLTSIADAALQEISNVLGRMAELAEQSSNGIFTTAQRSALSTEFIALGSEVERIAQVTEFNNLTLLSGSSSIAFQVGLKGGANSLITITSVLGTLASLGLAGVGQSSLSYSILTTTATGSQSASQLALNAVTSAINILTNNRGTLGAAESRLSHAINFLTVTRENFIAAESRIRDIDVAEESATLTRLTILQQAATAIVAQANQQPQLVLSLLR